MLVGWGKLIIDVYVGSFAFDAIDTDAGVLHLSVDLPLAEHIADEVRTSFHDGTCVAGVEFDFNYESLSI